MIKPLIRASHAVWRQPRWQLALLLVILFSMLAWAFFGIASVPGPEESFSDTAEERLIVLGAGAAAVIAIWGVAGQWAISSRQLTIQFLRQIETDKDFIRDLEIFNQVAACGNMLRYAHTFQKPDNWKELAKEERRRCRLEFNKTARAIQLVLNTDEMVAIGVKNAILDYRLVCAYRRGITIRRWNAAKQYVDAERTNTGPHTLWIELERLAKRLEDDPYHMIL